MQSNFSNFSGIAYIFCTISKNGYQIQPHEAFVFCFSSKNCTSFLLHSQFILHRKITNFIWTTRLPGIFFKIALSSLNTVSALLSKLFGHIHKRCVRTCVKRFEIQRTTLGVIPQVQSSFHFFSQSLTGPEISKQLTECPVNTRDLHVSTLLVLGLQASAMPSSFFPVDFGCLHSDPCA